MKDYINVLIVLVASIVYTAVAILVGVDQTVWAYNLILVIIIFSVIGYFFRRYLIKNIFNDTIEDNQKIIDDNIEGTEESQEEFEDDIIGIDNEEIQENKSFFETLEDE